jgi:hypothetical protein
MKMQAKSTTTTKLREKRNCYSLQLGNLEFSVQLVYFTKMMLNEGVLKFQAKKPVKRHSRDRKYLCT